MPDSDSESPTRNRKQKKEKTRRPANTAFRQQRLKAWQPILTPKTVLPLFFILGVVFAPIGGLLLWASAKVQEITLDYTHCATRARGDEFVDMPSSEYKYYFEGNAKPVSPPQWRAWINESSPIEDDWVCSVQFSIPRDFKSPVLLFYRLTNFYQNHRRYVKSVDERQIRGEAVSAGDLKSSDACAPLITNSEGKPYYPCGLIANSWFNDTFFSPVLLNVRGGDDRNETYQMTNKGIAWEADKERFGKTKYKLSDIVPPPHWVKRYPNNYTEENPPPNLKEWEELQVWMRTAGLPTFSKLALRNDDKEMVAGTYHLDIQDRFNVTLYGGTKSVVISTRTVMGGRNPFLGIAYIVVAGICVLLGTLFTARHLIKPRKLGDHTYLSWNNDVHPPVTQGGQAA